MNNAGLRSKILRLRSIVNTNLYYLRITLSRPVIALLLTTILSSCSGGQNFSQFPGFAQHFANYPPSDSPPTTAEVAILQQYKPRIFASEGQMQPVDFYKDYIAHGTLHVDGKKHYEKPTAALLNQYRDDPNALFEYKGDYNQPGTSVIYARIDYEQITHQNKKYDFTFLTYNLVFPVSGILQGLGTLQSFGLAIVGNLSDWHQLDHYVNVSVVLLDSNPVAMTLQQHNYQTTYMLDPRSPEIAVDIAMRSNELYPHSSNKEQHPAVSFLSADNIEFLISNKNKPMMAGYDITHGAKEINYELMYLPQTDAFYQFKGSLGKNRLLPGRSGPPGADYATLPELMPRHIRLITGLRTDSADTEIALFNKLFDKKNFAIRPLGVNAYKDRFFSALNKLQQ